MNAQRLHAAAFASALLLAAAPTAIAQTTGGSQGGLDGRNVSASTYGAGTITQNGTGVAGGGEAVAVDGSASTRTDARLNERRAMQRSVAKAQTEDERAISRTRTNVNTANETIRSSTTTRYKERGAPPVRETVRTVTTPEGTETRIKSKGPK